MVITGRLVYRGDSYFVLCNSLKSKITWYLLSPIHKLDRVNRLKGLPMEHGTISSPLEITKFHLNDNYVLEAIELQRNSIDKKYFGRLRVLPKLLNEVDNARDYIFSKDNILEDSRNIVKGVTIRVKSGQDENTEIEMITEDHKYSRMLIKNKIINLDMSLLSKGSITDDLTLVPLEEKAMKKLNIATLYTVNMQDLRTMLDLSWYEDENGNKLKDYGVIETVEQFEKEVIDEIVKEYHKCVAKGEQLILSIDTETTGLNICYLDDSNPDKDFVVAIPISWRTNQARVIFIDMEHFENVPKEYVFSRLKLLVEKNEMINLKVNNEVKSMDFFDGRTYDTLTDDQYILDRRQIDLVGHNTPYDGKVFYDNGVRPWWDDDTLQMAFDLNPKVGKAKITLVEYDEEEIDGKIVKTNPHLIEVKGGVSLKNITRRLYGHETPELSDLLGKGNEGRYRDIRDKQVAEIYGCADADYTRQIRLDLRKLMTDHMFKMYRMQDMPMLNILYVSEYYGLLTNEENVKVMAVNAKRNREIIHEFLENYVGIFVNYTNLAYPLKVKLQTGMITKAEYDKALKEIKIDTNATYSFQMKATDIRKVLYDILKYPILAYTEGKNGKGGQPKVDKFCMKKLASIKDNHNYLKSDILGADGKTVLIAKDKFNSLKYPLAYVLSTYAAIDKEYTAYYKPMMEKNMEGRMFKGYSLARIETRRIMNPLQTVKSELKDNILAFDGGKDWYMVDFDMAQVEYRIMVSISGQTEMIERLKDPEKDFHTESAAMLKGVPAYTIDKHFRKQMKAVHFGIPYGLGDPSLCEKMHGKINEDTMYETRKLKSEFMSKNDRVIAMLEHHRDEALIPRDLSYEFKKFAGFVQGIEKEDGTVEEVVKPVGWVKNLLGFYRLFDLSNLDKKRIGIIRRAAGNFPIQAFAAELFRMILIRFYNRCVKEGVEDKVIWHMLIHDELLMSVHKSVHPFFLYKMIMEECMITFKGHTKYFVGIGIGNTWGDAKSDKYEAPVLFVQRMVKRWEAGEFKDEKWIDNPKDYVMSYMNKYIQTRIHEVLKQLTPAIDESPIDIKYIVDNMGNYTVRAYITDNYVPNKYKNEEGKVVKGWFDLKNPEQMQESLAQWSSIEFSEDKELLCLDGVVRTAKEIIEAPVNAFDTTEVELEFDDDKEEMQTDDYWEFGDEEDLDEYVDSLYFEDTGFEEDDFGDEYGFAYDLTNDKATNVADLMITKAPSYKYIQKLRNQIVVSLPKANIIPAVKERLAGEQDAKGLPILFKIKHPMQMERWVKVKADIDIASLDEYIDKYIQDNMELKDKKIPKDLKHVNVLNNQVVIKLPRILYSRNVSEFIEKENKGGKYVNCIYSVNGRLIKGPKISTTFDFETLDKYVEEVVI